jgi:hypothetical protein
MYLAPINPVLHTSTNMIGAKLFNLPIV